MPDAAAGNFPMNDMTDERSGSDACWGPQAKGTKRFFLALLPSDPISTVEPNCHTSRNKSDFTVTLNAHLSSQMKCAKSSGSWKYVNMGSAGQCIRMVPPGIKREEHHTPRHPG